MQIANPSKKNGCRYGIVPLGIEENKCSFLVFGGFGASGFIKRTGIFTTMMNDFVDSDLIMIDNGEDETEKEEETEDEQEGTLDR